MQGVKSYKSRFKILFLVVWAICLTPIEKALSQENILSSNSHTGRVPFACSDAPDIYPSIARELEPFQGVTADAFLENSVILGRPTDSSIGISILPTEDLTQVQIHYGSGAEEETITLELAEEMAKCVAYEYDLEDLKPNTAYQYEISYLAGEGQSHSTAQASFQTARSPGATFSFAVQADPHLGSLYRFERQHPLIENQNEGANEEMYAVTMANTAASGADFLIDLGDTFMTEKSVGRGLFASQIALFEAMQGEDENVDPIAFRSLPVTKEEVRGDYVYLRSQFASAAHTVPLFFAVGNHEIEVRRFASARNGSSEDYIPALWGANARHDLFPVPNSCETQDVSFYSVGSLEPDPDLGVCHDSYYSFVWGDALFIALDPMWFEARVTGDAPRQWRKTLGLTQYNWLHDTLQENADVPFKFVFMHNLVGGYSNSKGNERAGALVANYYEWGGCTEQLSNIDDPTLPRNMQRDIIHPENFDVRASVNGEDGKNCTYEFDQYRPDFAHGPIQDMLIEAGVQVVFHGHDHLFVSELHPNGIVYQEIPKPSDSGDALANALARASGYNYDTTGAVPEVETSIDSNSGFVLVTVNAGLENGAQTTRVEYRKSVEDTSCLNGSADCYTVDEEAKTSYSIEAR